MLLDLAYPWSKSRLSKDLVLNLHLAWFKFGSCFTLLKENKGINKNFSITLYKL